MQKVIRDLDSALDIAELRKSMKHVVGDYVNVSIDNFVNRKSFVVRDWAERHGISFCCYSPDSDTTVIYQSNAFGIIEGRSADPDTVAEQLFFSAVEHLLDKDRVVVYFPRYYYATPSNKKVIEHLMNTHSLVNPKTGKEFLWENLLFVVVDNEKLG